jgi:hypothetical protein
MRLSSESLPRLVKFTWYLNGPEKSTQAMLSVIICIPVNGFKLSDLSLVLCLFPAPHEDIKEPLKQYYELGLTDKKVAELFCNAAAAFVVLKKMSSLSMCV